MQINKVIGIGMSKTGTTTLGKCLELLGFTPHQGHNRKLKQHLVSGGAVQQILAAAEKYRALEDSPWYLLYRELDEKFPGSKFILTVRKDSMTHARSSWYHGVRAGSRRGELSEHYLADKIRVYEEHNRQVMDYFKNRPDDLLVICWEKGDGWEKLCDFLGVTVPDVALPHENTGRQPRSGYLSAGILADSVPLMMVRRMRNYLSGVTVLRVLDKVISDEGPFAAPKKQESSVVGG